MEVGQRGLDEPAGDAGQSDLSQAQGTGRCTVCVPQHCLLFSPYDLTPERLVLFTI